MKKSNSKNLYKFACSIKNKSIKNEIEDSLDCPQPAHPKKPKHLRSQSCPFENNLNEDMSNLGTDRKLTCVKNKKSCHQSSASQLSIGCKTVIIKQGSDNISLALFKKKTQGNIKRNNIKVKFDCYAKIKLQQMIRGYKLRQQLMQLQKQTLNSNIKQKILQSLLYKAQQQQRQTIYQFA